MACGADACVLWPWEQVTSVKQGSHAPEVAAAPTPQDALLLAALEPGPEGRLRDMKQSGFEFIIPGAKRYQTSTTAVMRPAHTTWTNPEVLCLPQPLHTAHDLY